MGGFTQLKLMRGDTQLGILTVYDLDMPWFLCRFVPDAAFENVRPLFDAELDVLNKAGTDFDPERWEKAYQDIEALGLCLIPDAGEKIGRFLLHIKDTEAWFCY
jgi:hypothetical protein